MKPLFLALILLFLVSCNNTVDVTFIESNLWTYENGFRVGEGDAIAFGKHSKIYSIKGDTLYYMDNPRAIIKYAYDNGYRMKLVSLDQKEEGIYRNTAESLR